MKNRLLSFAVVGSIVLGVAQAQGGYSGGVKPAIVTQTPPFAEHFVASSVDKLSKTKSFVVYQFNVNVAEEEYLDLRSGGAKGSMNDAMVNLQFKLTNLDKKMMQAATDELCAYLDQKLKAEGFVTKDYETLKASKHFQKLTITEPLNGASTSEIDPASRPGFADNKSAKFIGFSANNMPSVNIFGTKGTKLIYIGKDMEADVLGFGLSVHFIEWEGSTKFGKVETSYKPQVFFGVSNATIFPYQKIGNVIMINQKGYGYSFGRDFVSETKEGADQSVIENAKYKTIEITVDNEKFKGAVVELGKSYIDNIVTGLKTN